MIRFWHINCSPFSVINSSGTPASTESAANWYLGKTYLLEDRCTTTTTSYNIHAHTYLWSFLGLVNKTIKLGYQDWSGYLGATTIILHGTFPSIFSSTRFTVMKGGHAWRRHPMVMNLPWGIQTLVTVLKTQIIHLFGEVNPQ